MLSVDTETNYITMVLNPNVPEQLRNRTETLSLLQKTTMESIMESEEGKGIMHSFCLILFSIVSIKYSFFMGSMVGTVNKRPPPQFDSCTCLMWVEFVLVCCWFSPCSRDFSLGSPVFLPPRKPTLLNSNSI